MSSWIERLLPWFDPVKERMRDARTEIIKQRSEVARQRSASVIAAYRRADEFHMQSTRRLRQAAEDVIDETER